MTTRVTLRVQPRASRDGVAWEADRVLRVRVAAPPSAGEANEAVVEVLAAALSVRRRAIRLVAGHRGRTKIAEVDGLTAAAIRQRLEI